LRPIIFRALAGIASVLFLFGAVLMAKDDAGGAVLTGALGLLFGAYAALVEYRIRWALRLLGAKDNTSQKTGDGKSGD